MPKRKRQVACASHVESEAEKPVKRAKSGLVNLKHIPRTIEASFKHNDSSCALLRLPGNVRNLIYSYVIVPRYARIHYKPHEHRRRQKDKVKFVEHIVGGWGVTWYSEQVFLHDGGCLRPDQWRPTAVSRVCQRLNAETSLLIFSSNIFAWGNEWEMKNWLKNRLPIQKRAIERLHLEWKVTETQRKELKGLKTVYYSTKGMVCSNPWESWVRRLLEGDKKWWKERDVRLLAVEATGAIQKGRN